MDQNKSGNTAVPKTAEPRAHASVRVSASFTNTPPKKWKRVHVQPVNHVLPHTQSHLTQTEPQIPPRAWMKTVNRFPRAGPCARASVTETRQGENTNPSVVRSMRSPTSLMPQMEPLLR